MACQTHAGVHITGLTLIMSDCQWREHSHTVHCTESYSCSDKRCEPAWLVAIIERQESVVMVRPTLLLASASSHSPFVLTGPAAAAAATRH